MSAADMRYHAYHELLENNRAWARARRSEDPTFFERLAEGQRPPFLFIGCSDSRKPLNTITGTQPGELFVHRNVANQVREDDANGRAVLEYAVEVLRVRHVIVCGHTRCGGVEAAIRQVEEGARRGEETEGGPGRGGGEQTEDAGAVQAWIAPLVALYRERREEVGAGAGAGADQAMAARVERLARANVVAQVENIRRLPVVREALEVRRDLAVHGWLFRVENGIIEEVEV